MAAAFEEWDIGCPCWGTASSERIPSPFALLYFAAFHGWSSGDGAFNSILHLHESHCPRFILSEQGIRNEERPDLSN